MFDNIGEKIKGLASFIFWFQAIIAVLAGVVIAASNEDSFVVGMLIMLVGPVFAWASSLTLYGFGEAIVKLTKIEENTRKEGATAEVVASDADNAEEKDPGYVVLDEKKVACKRCGFRQKKGRAACWNCDYKFEIDTAEE